MNAVSVYEQAKAICKVFELSLENKRVKQRGKKSACDERL